AEDVIRTARTGLNDQRQIGRQGTVVRGTCRLIVRERSRNWVRRPSWALEHLTFVVWSVRDLIAGGDGLYLVLGVADIGEVAEVQVLDRMADRANLLVNLKAALRRRPVVGTEDSIKGPLLAWQWRALIRCPCRSRDQHEGAKHHHCGQCIAVHIKTSP